MPAFQVTRLQICGGAQSLMGAGEALSVKVDLPFMSDYVRDCVIVRRSDRKTALDMLEAAAVRLEGIVDVVADADEEFIFTSLPDVGPPEEDGTFVREWGGISV